MAVSPVLYQVLAAVLFCIGVMGVLFRRNILVIFMCVELMLNAANLSLIAFARSAGERGRSGRRVLCPCRGGGRGVGGARHHHRSLPQEGHRGRGAGEPAQGISHATTLLAHSASAAPRVPGERAWPQVDAAQGGGLAGLRCGGGGVPDCVGALIELIGLPLADRSVTRVLFPWIMSGDFHVNVALHVGSALGGDDV